MSRPRILLAGVLVAALAAVGVLSGLSRVHDLREERRGEVLDAVRRAHLDLGQRLETLLDLGQRQTDYAARLPQVRDLLAAGLPRDEAVAAVAALVETFDDLEEVAVLDRAGRVHLRVRSDGAPVPAEPLAAVADDGERDEGLSAPLGVGGAGRAPTLRLAAPVSAGSDVVGQVLVSLAVDPLREALRQVQPVPGIGHRLLPPEASPGPAPRELTLLPPRVRDGAQVHESLLSRPAGVRLETELPARALELAMAPLRSEYAWIAGSVLAYTAVVGVVGAAGLLLVQRALRLRETERYLRWIRRVTDRYRALMEGAADMILIVEPARGRVREANAAAREVLGPAVAGGEGREAVELAGLLAEPSRAAFRAALDAAGGGGPPAAVPDLRIRGASGGELAVDARVARVELADEVVVQVSLRDVTRQREMERQLQLAERLSSLGLLTAGVAHEINNPLEGIGNYLSLLERPGLDDEQRRRWLEQVRRGFSRIRDIVQDLLSFARPAAPGGLADLRLVVDAVLGMARYAGGFRDVDVRRSGLDAPLPVPGDAGRLEQVLLNLLLNAARAMAGSGTIWLSARRLTDEGDGQPGVELTVEDSGPGIPPELLGRIFDPFFSGHGGTGLGLAVSFGIVRAHGGTLAADNRPGGGAVFRLRLPAAPVTARTGSTP